MKFSTARVALAALAWAALCAPLVAAEAAESTASSTPVWAPSTLILGTISVCAHD